MLLLTNSPDLGDPVWRCEPCETTGYRLEALTPGGHQLFNAAQLSRQSLEDLYRTIGAALQDADEPKALVFVGCCGVAVLVGTNCPRCGEKCPAF